MRRSGRGALIAGLALGLLTAEVAWAEIFKCTGPDGKVHYTSDPSHCAKAERQALKTDLQRVLKDEAPRRRAPRPAAKRPGGDGLEAMWRTKRPKAEKELAALEQRVERMRRVVRDCNRGAEWYRTTDAGIREHLPCDQLKSQYAELQESRDKLREYLNGGLEDECRRAGCQPGWIR